ncbi:MAG: biopolymer transporter ExbD [Prevotellaceae bacterium]|jgi:biopolymer transport protein ExbD|nr:biopolymer transporter ExbD [Prevotellaceae bacterium]
MARPAGEINAGSMADIAFLMLIFFIVNSTMDVDAGLQRMLPPMPDESQQQEKVEVNRRNLFVVLITSSGRISAGGQLIDISQLKDKTREFILNSDDNPSLPEKEMKDIANFGLYPVSKGVISLQNDRSTTYDIYIQVQNELIRAYNELRDEFSMQHYGKPFVRLEETQQKVVRTIYNQNISEAEPRDVGKKR